MEATPLRFSLDGSLGRLSRWLRLLGHDAAWRPGDGFEKAALRARSEGRILLTRSKSPLRLGLSWPPFGGLVIVSTGLVDQLVEVARRWPIFADAPFLSRCAECNEPLRPMATSEAISLVPPFVARTQTDFRACDRCGRIYWNATHADAILRTIRAAKEAARPGSDPV